LFADLDIHELLPSGFLISQVKFAADYRGNIAQSAGVSSSGCDITLTGHATLAHDPANFKPRRRTIMKRHLIPVAILATLALPANAANIVDEWASVKPPAAPTLKLVTVDPKTTALLMLDFMNQNYGQRPRCLDTIPAMKKLLAEARANKVPMVYSIIANSTLADVIKDVAPQADEPHVLSGADKFRNTDLEKILKDKGITTVIAVGTSSNGAVLYTGSGAAFRGMNVIVPVDGISAVDPYAEYSAVFTFMNAPQVSAKTMLTRSDMIKF
jgi:nicotinamidase-related amidase